MNETLFHVTTRQNAKAILSSGFIDHRGCYGLSIEIQGVWLSDVPLDSNEGAEGDVVLTITFNCPLAELADYEVIEEGKSYREWCIPAPLINSHAKVELYAQA